jgi:hypothetical protein
MALGAVRTYPPYERPLVMVDLVEPWPRIPGTVSYMRWALGVGQTIGRV